MIRQLPVGVATIVKFVAKLNRRRQVKAMKKWRVVFLFI